MKTITLEIQVIVSRIIESKIQVHDNFIDNKITLEALAHAVALQEPHFYSQQGKMYYTEIENYESSPTEEINLVYYNVEEEEEEKEDDSETAILPLSLFT